MAAQAAADAVWQAHFQTHAMLLTTNTCPTSIVLCGITGGPDRWLKIGLYATRPSLTFVRQVLDGLPSRLEPMTGNRLGVRFSAK